MKTWLYWLFMSAMLGYALVLSLVYALIAVITIWG